MTSERALQISRFLSRSGWSTASQSPVSGDASGRRYVRLEKSHGNTAILMDAPPTRCGSQEAFVRIGRYLRSIGLAAPAIFDFEPALGLILMEDLGDHMFAAEAQKSDDLERLIYSVAVDVLIHLQRPAPCGLTHATPDVLTEMVLIAFTHYADVAPDCSEVKTFLTEFHDTLTKCLSGPPVLVLRDYHAENLVWRSDREGLSRAGLLDFQDAVAGPPAYDLVSLLQDARRDLRPELEAEMVNKFVEATGVDAENFDKAYHAISVQRHLRILGVFARLAREGGRPDYLKYLPRTWTHLQNSLKHECLQELSIKLNRLLPSPSEDLISDFKARRHE